MRSDHLTGGECLQLRPICLASQTECDALFVLEEAFINPQKKAQCGMTGTCRKQSQGFTVDFCFPEAQILYPEHQLLHRVACSS